MSFLKKYFVIFALTLLNFGCSQDSSDTSNKRSSAVSSLPTMALEKGINYSYYKDGSCVPSDAKVCINFDEYKELCGRSTGITKNAASTLVIFDAAARNLLDGGQVDSSKVSWNSNNQYPCRATVVVSGIYMGNSTRREMEGGATTFTLSRSDEVLVNSASTTNY